MKKVLFMFVWACVATLLHLQARAQIVIEITRGQEKPIPIAVVPFGWERSDAQRADVADIVAADLKRSGRFEPVARDKMDKMGDKPTRGDDIRFQDWKSFMATDYILVGRIVGSGEQATVQFELYNTLSGKRLLNHVVPSPVASLRGAAHRVSDLVYETLTGTPGAFATRIAFVRVSGTPPTQRYELVVADSDAENETWVFRSESPIMSPAWSPDGLSLAYVSFEQKVASIWVQNVDTTERRQVSARAGINGAPAWSPDMRSLALTLSRKDGDVDVYTLDLANQVLTRMTFDSGIDTEPVWSMDGKKLYFTSDRAGGPQIYEVNIDDPRTPRRLTFDGTYNARARVSPDGKKLALVHRENGNDRIAVLDLANKSLQTVSNGRDDESPSFAPNGAMIMYATQSRGRSALKVVSTNGNSSGEYQLKGEVREPAWAPFPRKQ